MPYSFIVTANRVKALARTFAELAQGGATGARTIPYPAAVAVGSQSSTLFPSGSMNQPKRP